MKSVFWSGGGAAGARAFLCAFVFTISSGFAAAEDASQVIRVKFRNGQATIRGVIRGYGTADHVFPAGAGESMDIKLSTRNLSTYFTLTAPGANEAAFMGETGDNHYKGAATVAGDYTVRVYMMRNEARRGKVVPYRLTIAVGRTAATNEQGPDFADGLTGGPDYWEVTGVPAGDWLSLRATPTPSGKLVTRVGNTAVLKNHGCKNTRGQRWCHVEDGAGRKAWVNGKYLKEAAWPPR